MKDVYFNNYNKKDSKYDTSEIPLTDGERAFQDRINQEKYERIINNQKRTLPGIDEYDDILSDFSDTPQRKSQRSGQRQTGNQTPRQNSNNQRKPSPAGNGKKKKKKRGCGCATIFICFILIIALLCGGTYGYVYSLCSKTNYVQSPVQTVSTNLTYSDDVYNVLLLGTDEDDNGTSRSDTMMLVSLDKKNKMIKFTSFMRDMWVTIPENGEAKLNAAFAYGGAPLVVQTIEENFKIRIDNYVMVNFEMFEKLIDGLGGVKVEITESEASFINRTTHAHVEEGINTLNGDYALIYCRIRKLDSDFMRTQRQRKVMSAIMEQLKSQDIPQIIKAMTDVLPLITTDISPKDMTNRAFSSISLLSYGNDQMRIPVDGLYESKMKQGQDALVPDIDENTAQLKSFIYG